MEETRSNFIDKWSNKIISRKLMVWIVSTIMVFMGSGLSGEHWVWISLIYIGSQAAIDIVNIVKNKSI